MIGKKRKRQQESSHSGNESAEEIIKKTMKLKGKTFQSGSSSPDNFSSHSGTFSQKSSVKKQQKKMQRKANQGKPNEQFDQNQNGQQFQRDPQGKFFNNQQPGRGGPNMKNPFQRQMTQQMGGPKNFQQPFRNQQGFSPSHRNQFNQQMPMQQFNGGFSFNDRQNDQQMQRQQMNQGQPKKSVYLTQELCKFFLTNNCHRGDSCNYSHQTDKFPCKYLHGTGV